MVRRGKTDADDGRTGKKLRTQISHGRRRLVLRPQGEDTRGLPSGDVMRNVLFRGRSWSELAWMGDRANAGPGSETKSQHNETERSLVPVLVVGWSVLVHPFRWAPRPLFAAKQFLGGWCVIW